MGTRKRNAAFKNLEVGVDQDSKSRHIVGGLSSVDKVETESWIQYSFCLSDEDSARMCALLARIRARESGLG